MTENPAASVALVLTLAIGFGCAEPGSPDLALARARNAVLNERSDWARQYFAEDFAENPDHVESLRDGAYAWLSGYQRSRSEATRLLEEYLELRPEDHEARRVLVNEHLVNRNLDLGRRWAVELDNGPESNLLRAKLWASDDPARAAELLLHCLEQDPDNGGALAFGAVISERLGDSEQAMDRGLRALEVQPFNYQTIYLLGRLWRRAGDEQRADWALAMHQKLAALTADGTRPQLSPAEELGLLLELQDELPSSNYAFQKRLVTAYFSTRDLVTAENLTKTVIDTYDVPVPELIALAASAEDAGRRAFALDILARVNDVDPGNVSATTAFAVAAIDEGRIDDALRLIAAGRTKDPQVAYYSFLEGRVKKMTDDLEGAAASLEEALRLAPWEAGWRMDLADVALARRDFTRFRSLVATAPEQPRGWLEYCDRHRSILETE